MTLGNALTRVFLLVSFGASALGCSAADYPGTEEAPAGAVSQPISKLGWRPAGVPADYVATPHGFFHPDCVVEVQSDERIDTKVHALTRADGRKRPYQKCGHARFDRNGKTVAEVEPAEKAAAAEPPPQIDGWIISAANYVQGPVRSLSASFAVPAAPIVPDGQIVYLFPGMQPPSGNTIIQPVLGWNHYGDGQRWSMASWNCCVDGNVWHSPIQPVNAGDVLNGSMTGTNCDASGVCANWRVDTLNTANNQLTRLDTTAYGQTMETIFGGALEIYGVTDCKQLPANGSVTFNNIVTNTVAGGNVSYPWFAPTPLPTPDCEFNAVTTNNSVQLTWTDPGPLVALPRTGWVATASSTAGADVPARALDGNAGTRFSTGVPQSSTNAQTFTLDLQSAKTFKQLVIESPGDDYARNYEVYAGDTAGNINTFVAYGYSSAPGPTTVSFPRTTARFVQVRVSSAFGVGSWWSINEINLFDNSPTQPPGAVLPRTGWVVSASATGGADVPARAIDANTGTRWTSGSPQSTATTRTFTVDMAAAKTFAKLVLESGGDYARSYQVYASNDGVNWGASIAAGTATGATTTITFPTTTARYLQVRQLASAGTGAWWSIHELNVYAP